MPVAVNDKGDAVYFDDNSKSWKPARVAANDKGDKKAFDGKAWVDLPGSVFDKPSLRQRIGRTEAGLKRLAPAAAGAVPAIAGAEEGAALGTMVSPGVGTAIGGAIGAGIGGAFSPAVARQVVAAQTKQPYQAPSWKEVAKSSAFNAGMTGLFGAIGARSGRAAATEPEIRSLPAEAQTAGNVKQAMRNRDFWKQMGLSDEQATEALRSPDVHAEMERQIQSGQRYKAAFQTVVDNTRKTFNDRYEPILATEEKISTVPIGQMFESLAQGPGQHELTPTFRAFLQRKGLELTRAGEATGPSVGGVPWKQLPEKLREQIRTQGGSQGIKAPSEEMTPKDLQGLRTELRENLPASATNLDKQAYEQLRAHITEQIKAPLAPEQRGALDALDQEYARFQDVLKTLDPRSERYGTQVANALFDPMVKNQGDALNFVKLAQEAEAARPGEVMPQLREGFLEHATNESRIATQGRPVEEMQALRKLQAKWGGDKQLKTVLTGIYGKDSPLTDATTFSKVVGVLGNPDASAAKASKTMLTGAGELLTRGTSFLTRLAVSYGIYRSIAGGTGSPWKDIGNPEAMIPALAGAWMLGKVGSPILASADTALQKTYVNYLLNPTPNTFRLLGETLGAGGAGLLIAPSLTAEVAPPTPTSPPVPPR